MWPWSSKKLPAAEALDDVVLGRLTFSDGGWNGRVSRNGCDLEVSIAGDLSGPVQLGRELLVAALERFEGLVEDAKGYLLKDLSPQDLAKGPYQFRPTGLWSGAAWQLAQRSVTLTLELERDEYALWRVEMGALGPLDSGRDS